VGWLLVFCSAVEVVAVPPPTVTVAATGLGQVKGGVALGNSGRIYFSGLTANGKGYVRAYVRALDGTHQQLWLWYAPGSEPPIYNVPALNPDGTRLYIGTDDGQCYCLDTANGVVLWSYAVPTGNDRRIRSSVAVDWTAPSGPTVYFHSFNGRLYALDATTGTQRWAAITGNFQPASHPDHPEPFSSSPVIGSGGLVYVGSANGSVYCVDPQTGLFVWASPLCAEPIEATVALSAQGRVYVATRQTEANPAAGGRVFGLDAATGTLLWTSSVQEGIPGIIASPVIDRMGFVYVAAYHDKVWKFDPANGTLLHVWYAFGKMCQTPSIAQDGTLIVGTSSDSSNNQGKRAIRAFDLNQPDPADPQQTPSPALWSVFETDDGQPVGDFLGSPAIRCADGSTYLGDTTGRLYLFDVGAPMMAGQWPTFQRTVRRAGKSIGYAYLIAELPNFQSGTATPTAWNVNRYGHVVGQAHGYYRYPYGSEYGYCAALWKNAVLVGYGGANAVGPSFASAINCLGDSAGYYYQGAVIWPNGASSGQVLPLLSGFDPTSAQATDIADDRTIVGYGANSSGTHVLRWYFNGTSWLWVESLSSDGNQAQAFAISAGGRLAGRAKFTANGPWRAYKTEPHPSEIIPQYALGTFGGTESWAWDIHEASGVVGWAHNAQGRRRAFYVPLEGTTLQELPRLSGTSDNNYHSEAQGVNQYGEVVGKIQNDAGAWRAFYYAPGAATVGDLNLTPLASGGTPASRGWTLTSARAIGEGGVIVGQGYRNGVYKAWMLYPSCPE
jgi:outer membrane protein assembly factor BamB